MSDLYDQDHDADEAAELDDQDPIPGLGEAPAPEDAKQGVGPAGVADGDAIDV